MKELSSQDIKGLFDGKTTLFLSKGRAGPRARATRMERLPPYVREVILSMLLQAKVMKAA